MTRSHSGPIRFRKPLVSTMVQPSAFSVSSVMSVVIGLLSGGIGQNFRPFHQSADVLSQVNACLAKACSFEDDDANMASGGLAYAKVKRVARLADADARPWRCACANLSEPHHHDGGAVPARRLDLDRRPRHRRQDE